MSTINEQNETRTMSQSQEDTPRLALLTISLDSFQTGITGVCVQGVRDRQTDIQTDKPSGKRHRVIPIFNFVCEGHQDNTYFHVEEGISGCTVNKEGP